MSANNGFEEVVNEINSWDDGCIIPRRELLLCTSGLSDTTVDHYRRLITVNGYLKATDKTGRYEKVKDIPKSITYSMMRKFYEIEIRYRHLRKYHT